MQIKSNFILTLSDAAATIEQVGGKGTSLSNLAAADLPVPPGFYITTAAYRRFVADHGLQKQILATVAITNPSQPATLEEASSRIVQLFREHPMADDMAEEIRRAYAELGEGDVPVAVRSSATAEDLPETSFAGQQESYLNIHGIDEVLDAIKNCWASLWTARAIAYRIQNKIDQNTLALEVVVQKLVFADAAGIMFTANPINWKRNEAVINA
ncbi:MAG: pyruvate, phosphate dikinase, partial [Chloroflexota bacterium]